MFFPHLVFQHTGSDCMANIKHSPVPNTQNTSGGVNGRQHALWQEYESATGAVTGEDEDEKGADASDDADDFADVGDKDGDEQRHGDPQDGQRVAAAALKGQRGHAVTPPPPAQQRVLDHRPDGREQICCHTFTSGQIQIVM